MEQKLILRLDLGTIPGYLIMWKLQNLWKKNPNSKTLVVRIVLDKGYYNLYHRLIAQWERVTGIREEQV
jgi:hypothetical protein